MYIPTAFATPVVKDCPESVVPMSPEEIQKAIDVLNPPFVFYEYFPISFPEYLKTFKGTYSPVCFDKSSE